MISGKIVCLQKEEAYKSWAYSELLLNLYHYQGMCLHPYDFKITASSLLNQITSIVYYFPSNDLQGIHRNIS